MGERDGIRVEKRLKSEKGGRKEAGELRRPGLIRAPVQ